MPAFVCFFVVCRQQKIKQLTTRIEDQKKVNDDLEIKVSSFKKMQSDAEDTIKLLKKHVASQKAVRLLR